jgi:hypothetical protein
MRFHARQTHVAGELLLIAEWINVGRYKRAEIISPETPWMPSIPGNSLMVILNSTTV